MLFAVAVGAVEATARGRGGNVGIWSGLAAVAYAIGYIFGRFTYGRDSFVQYIPAWVLLGIVALIVRFVVGARKPQRDGIWSCPNCHMVNEASYVVCQACEQPWSPS